jgi:hypothetical protein
MKTGCVLCNVVNPGDKPNCQKIIDCWIANSCGPTSPCSQDPGPCSLNSLGVDMAPWNAAQATYTCSCS